MSSIWWCKAVCVLKTPMLAGNSQPMIDVGQGFDHITMWPDWHLWPDNICCGCVTPLRTTNPSLFCLRLLVSWDMGDLVRSLLCCKPFTLLQIGTQQPWKNLPACSMNSLELCFLPLLLHYYPSHQITSHKEGGSVTRKQSPANFKVVYFSRKNVQTGIVGQ